MTATDKGMKFGVNTKLNYKYNPIKVPEHFLPSNVPVNLPENVPAKVQANLSEKVQANLSEKVQANLSEKVPANLPENVPAVDNIIIGAMGLVVGYVISKYMV